MTTLTNIINNKQSSAFKIDEFLVHKITLMSYQLEPHFWKHAVEYHLEKMMWARMTAICKYLNALGFDIELDAGYGEMRTSASWSVFGNPDADVDSLAHWTYEMDDDVVYCKVSGDLFLPCNE